MSDSARTVMRGWMRFGGRLSLGVGLSTVVLMLGIAGARADSKSTFNGTPRATQLAALEASQNGPVAATDLAVERAMGMTPDTLAAPEDSPMLPSFCGMTPGAGCIGGRARKAPVDRLVRTQEPAFPAPRATRQSGDLFRSACF